MWDKKDQQERQIPTPAQKPRSSIPASGDYVKGRPINIGPSIQIKGELTGMEDLTIDGVVEGKIELHDHNLTVGPNGKIKADIYAQTIIITGEVRGNTYAKERVELGETGILYGDIVSPRISISDGAQFKGSVDMSQANRKEMRPDRTGKETGGRKPASADVQERTTVTASQTKPGTHFRELN